MATSRSGSLAPAPPALPQDLLDGAKFLKWTDQDSMAVPVTVMIERNGFFLYYFDQKDREVSVIDICQIRDIRTGHLARIPKDPKVRTMVSLGAGNLEDKTITIVYGVDFVNTNYLNFCSNKIEVASTWCSELWRYVRQINPLSICATNNLRKIHTELCLFSNGDKPIPAKQVLKYFAQSKEDRKLIGNALDQSGLPSGKGDEISMSKFTYEEFQTFYKTLLQRHERDVLVVFEKFCTGEPKRNVMNSKEFLHFLNSSQRDPRLNEILHPYATEEKAVFMIHKYEQNQHLVSRNELSVDGLMWYLMSEDNLVMSPESLLKADNMEFPLSHYYIKSSHNTYLTGHQITGKASVEIYRQVLLSGCRCIELDFWNGEGTYGEPYISHGYTMVNKLPAKDVIQAIAECAFRTSEYPLVLSFENHCNPKQQAKIAAYCKEYFGDLMLQYPLDDHPLAPNVQLPSPEQLKEKILVKNKVLHQHHHHHHKVESAPQQNGGQFSPSRRGGKDVPDVEASPPSLPPAPLAPSLANGSPPIPIGCEPPLLSDSSDSEESEDEDSMDSQESPKPQVTSDAGTAGKESKASAELSALVNYVMPVHFRTFENAEKRKRAYEMSSFVETTALSLLKQDPVEFVKYNRFQTSRVYPRGTRVESSNFMPQIFWNAGCQMVALNYQTMDIPMQLNLGKFQYNRRTGYLLKPDFMCREDRKFDPFTETSVDGIVSGTVSVQVLSGQFLTDKHVGTYIEVEMYGLPRDTVRRGKYRTRTVSPGISPVFTDDAFVFRQVILPDLALLRLAAYEESGNKLIGHRVLPVVGLCPGYRHIPLFNEAGQPLHMPCLFVHITVGDYVPNSLNELAEALYNPITYQSEVERREKQLALLADEEREEEERERRDTASLKDTGGSTPEIGSPTGSIPATSMLGRIGSAKPKDGSPKIGPIRTESSNSMTPSMKDQEQPTTSLETANLTPESLPEIMKHKSVEEKQQEMRSKMEQLLKKKDKDIRKLQDKLLRTPSKPKNPLGIIKKKFSTPNLESPGSTSTASSASEEVKRGQCEKKRLLERQHLVQEHELKERYLEIIYQCAEKVMGKSQSSQLKALESLHSREANDVMKRLEQESKVEEQEKGSMASVSREELQRERRARLVKRGVTERNKLQELYTGRRAELEAAQGRAREELRVEREAKVQEEKDQYKAAAEGLEVEHS